MINPTPTPASEPRTTPARGVPAQAAPAFPALPFIPHPPHPPRRRRRLPVLWVAEPARQIVIRAQPVPATARPPS